MFQVGRKAAELERTKLQSEMQRGRSEIRRRQLEKRVEMANKLGGRSVPPAKPKDKKEEEEDDYLEDLVVDADKKQKSYAKMETGGFVTRGADRKSRLDQRKAKIAATTEEPEDDEENETQQQKLEREVGELTSQLKKAERAREQARDKEERTKARRFSARITAGRYMKPPKAVTLVETRKRKKSMKTENILSAEEGEDEIDDIPEGFHLAAESPHCINMKRSEDYQAYLRQVVLQFERLVKTGGTDLRESYGQLIESMFWAVKANKQTILNGADPDEVLASIPDPKCRAWRQKLLGKTAVDPTTLMDHTDIGPQMASQVVDLKPQKIFELVEDEISRKSDKEINAIKKCIGNICKEQALAHRHAAEAADNISALTDMVSLPILMKVISATMRPTVAIKIPEVDEMLARAQEKVESIQKAKQKTGELRKIDEVIFAQNVPQYNPEWEHATNGRATSYLATLVCRYMHELQQKDTKTVLSARALETIYHTASSSIGKLISGKQYLGGYALDQVRDKVEAQGKQLPFKKKKKLPQRTSTLVKASTSAMEH